MTKKNWLDSPLKLGMSAKINSAFQYKLHNHSALKLILKIVVERIISQHTITIMERNSKPSPSHAILS